MGPRVSNGTQGVKDTINFITKAYDEIKDHLDTILNEKKERNSLNT